MENAKKEAGNIKSTTNSPNQAELLSRTISNLMNELHSSMVDLQEQYLSFHQVTQGRREEVSDPISLKATIDLCNSTEIDVFGDFDSNSTWMISYELQNAQLRIRKILERVADPQAFISLDQTIIAGALLKSIQDRPMLQDSFSKLCTQCCQFIQSCTLIVTEFAQQYLEDRLHFMRVDQETYEQSILCVFSDPDGDAELVPDTGGSGVNLIAGSNDYADSNDGSDPDSAI